MISMFPLNESFTNHNAKSCQSSCKGQLALCFPVTASARHLMGSGQVLIGLKGGLAITNRATFGTVAGTLAGPIELSV